MASFSPSPKSMLPGLVGQRHRDDTPVLAHLAALREALDRGLRRAVREARGESNPNAKCVASGSAALRAAATQSVGITSKPTPGQYDNARSPRGRVQCSRVLEHADLARDFEIMGVRGKTGRHHRCSCCGERSCTMQDDASHQILNRRRLSLHALSGRCLRQCGSGSPAGQDRRVEDDRHVQLTAINAAAFTRPARRSPARFSARTRACERQ